MIRVLIFLLMLPAAAWAQDWPSLHNVKGVSTNDTLNVRAAPTTSSDIVGQLASTQTNVEVVTKSPDGNWGQINVNELSGWVSMRFLSDPEPRGANHYPLACFGTEPFWSLEIGSNGTVIYESLDGETIRMKELEITPSANNTARLGVTAKDTRTKTSLFGFYKAQLCSDGMSDRTFGISVDFVVSPPTDIAKAFSGCCILSP